MRDRGRSRPRGQRRGFISVRVDETHFYRLMNRSPKVNSAMAGVCSILLSPKKRSAPRLSNSGVKTVFSCSSADLLESFRGWPKN